MSGGTFVLPAAQLVAQRSEAREHRDQLFNALAEDVFARIQRASNAGNDYLIYIVPDNLPGLPVVDPAWVTPLAALLHGLDYVVRVKPETRTLFVAWGANAAPTQSPPSAAQAQAPAQVQAQAPAQAQAPTPARLRSKAPAPAQPAPAPARAPPTATAPAPASAPAPAGSVDPAVAVRVRRLLNGGIGPRRRL